MGSGGGLCKTWPLTARCPTSTGRARARTNLRTMLSAGSWGRWRLHVWVHYRETGPCWTPRNETKLGAAALAGLAIMDSPGREEFFGELTMLAVGIESLVDNKPGFRTFFFPAERGGDNWNFYSGEALLFWAEALRRRESFVPTLEQCAKMSKCCRKMYFQKRNPAFVPWHT